MASFCEFREHSVPSLPGTWCQGRHQVNNVSHPEAVWQDRSAMVWSRNFCQGQLWLQLNVVSIVLELVFCHILVLRFTNVLIHSYSWCSLVILNNFYCFVAYASDFIPSDVFLSLFSVLFISLVFQRTNSLCY